MSTLLDGVQNSFGRAGKINKLKNNIKLTNEKKKQMIGQKFKKRSDVHHNNQTEDGNFCQRNLVAQTHMNAHMQNRRVKGNGFVGNANTTLSPQPRQMTIPMPSKHPSRT